MSRRLFTKKALLASAFFFACSPLFAAAPALDCPPDRIDASRQVAKIIDGDTVRLRSGDSVRFIGINTPEIGRDGKPSQPFSQRARQRLVQLLKAQRYTLNLRFGNERRDRYGRLLAHVYLADNRSIAAILLSEGLAAQVVVPPNVRDFRCYRKAEKRARAARRGIWSQPALRGIDARELNPAARGFHIVSGTVSPLKKSRGGMSFALDGKLTLYIAKSDRTYFSDDFLRSLPGKRVRVRGWIGARGKKPQMRLRHPASLEVE